MVSHKLEYIFVQDNLYLVSEAFDIALEKFVPNLVKEQSEFIGIQVVYDLLKVMMLHRKEYIDSRALFFKNGRLKYCALLLSPAHNVEIADDPDKPLKNIELLHALIR